MALAILRNSTMHFCYTRASMCPRPGSAHPSDSTKCAKTLTENTEDTATNTKSDTPAKSRGRRRRRPQAWTIDQFVVEPVEGKARFHDLDLPLSLMRGIADLGFEYCTPIQAESLPHALDGHDVVGKAQTGTGKTAAFLLNIITDLINHPIEGERFVGEARSMILAPTRELALQIAEDAVQLTRHTGLNVHALVGGMDYAKQLKHMETRHCDILVGTPGRLLDFANNRDVHLDQVEVLVIDEADRMLDMGFIPQVRRLVRLTPRNNERQTMLFSATFTPEVMRLSEQWTDSPVRIEIGAERVATDTVEQKIYITTSGEKFSLLNAILKGDNVQSVMVFANRRDICRRLHEKLGKKGFKVGLLSGDVPQTRRMKTLEAFKNGSIKVMVATDVAGRGIHVDGVSHVINYTLPEEPEDYVHRIGRTGRAGETGTSISFACEDDAVLLEPIEKLLGQKLPCTMPDEVFVKTPKAPKPDKEPSAALNDKMSKSPQPLLMKSKSLRALKSIKSPQLPLKRSKSPQPPLRESRPSAPLKKRALSRRQATAGTITGGKVRFKRLDGGR